MSDAGGSGRREWMRLREDFRISFDWKGADFTRDGFALWSRTRRNPPIHVDLKHKWRPFRDGEPVPREMVEAFSEYLSEELRIGRYTLRMIAEPCAAPAVPARRGAAKEPDLWRIGWAGTFGYFARTFSLPEEAYCRDEEDLMSAALMVVRHVGEAHSPYVGAAAVSYAERHLGRTVEEYAAFLLKLWKANENAVLFATILRGGEIIRLGCVASAPVTDGFFSRFRVGGVEDVDVTEADLLPESLNILISAVADDKELDNRRTKAERSVAMLKTGLAQFASMTPPLYKRDSDLRLVTFAGIPESRARMKSFNFREVNALTRVTGSPIAEFAPPSRGSHGEKYPVAFGEYLAMKAAVILFQAARGRYGSDPAD